MTTLKLSGNRESDARAEDAGARTRSSLGAGRRVLMLIQNEPLPQDQRVWQESLALRDRGFEVVAICPASEEYPELYCVVDGIEINRFRLRHAKGGALGYVREYCQALWRMFKTVRRVSRNRGFDVVHAANPPDLLLLTAWALRRRGSRLIFDHHDLTPELYLARFDRGRDALYRLTQLAQRVSFALAHVVISTNHSYRRVAIERGRKHPGDVFVVRNGPDLAQFAPAERDLTLRRGKPHLLVYVGVMGPQDGIDHALRALALLKRRRSDWHAVMIGAGDMEADLRRLSTGLGLEHEVEFTGWLAGPEVRRYLFSADIGLTPDPKSPLNDVSTLVKITEYMAASLAVVAYDLHESRISAADAALYAKPNEEKSFADCVEALLDDPTLREQMGSYGRERVEQSLSWQHSVAQLIAAYRRALDPAASRRASPVK